MGNLSTRSRLVLLLLLAALPALALTVYNAFDQRATAEQQARADLSGLARIGAQQQMQIVEGARQLMIGFSLVPPDLRNDAAYCHDYVRQVLQKTSGLYSAMGLYGPDGAVKCVGAFPDRDAQRAADSGQLAIGEYPRTALVKPDGFTLSYPIPDAARNTVDVAFVVLNLAEFGEVATRVPLPESAVLTIIDRKNVVLARNPPAKDVIGSTFDAVAAPESVFVATSGSFIAGKSEGGEQLYAYEMVPEGPAGSPALRVLASLPLSVIYADANQTLIHSLAGVILVTLLLLAAAWFGAEHFFLRNVRTLLNTARRISAGDLSARTGMTYGNEELSQIGKAFDEMAQSLHERQKRIDTALVTLHQQSITDSLTRLHNRRYLYETLPREIVRAKRNSATIAVVIVDLDHFKRINDSYGHEAGDMVLRWVGNVLMKSVRGSDVVCRHGGEEFCLALPEASIESAMAKADDIRQEIEALKLDYCGQPLRITASMGIAVYPAHGEDADTLLRHADEALYDAKECGRNRVVVYGKDVAFMKSHVAAASGDSRVSSITSAARSGGDSRNLTAGRRGANPPLQAVDTGGAPDREAAIQILTGPLVGKEYPLHNNATTVGKAGSEVAIISRTPQGYCLTHIEGGKFPVVNGSTIESRARQLANRDVIEVAGVKMVFFYK